MPGQRIGYVRVSSIDQNPERQLEQIPLDQVFTDQASGKDTQRPELERLLAFVRETDTVVVHSMDRLARNLDDLRRIVGKLTGRGVRIEFVKENLTFSGEDSPMANLMLSVMGAFAEFERALLRERQREGVAPGQAARGLPGPPEIALAEAGGPAPPPGPGRRGKDPGGGRVRHQPANPLPIPAHRRLTMTRLGRGFADRRHRAVKFGEGITGRNQLAALVGSAHTRVGSTSAASPVRQRRYRNPRPAGAACPGPR